MQPGDIPGYQLGEALSRSSLVQSWRARDSRGDEVVIKCYRPGAGAGGALVSFASRAASASSLRHPNMSTLRDRGKAGDALFAVRDFYAMGSLNEVVPSLSTADKLRLLAEIGRALEHAHQRGLVHGAVKPTNVMFATRDKPVLVDVGLVAAPQTGDFAAPEQGALGTTDPRSDQYSLAALGSWALVGHVATEGETISEDARLDQALRRALSKAPVDRFRRLDELLTVIETSTQASRRESVRPSGVHVEHFERTVRVQVTGNWTLEAIETCAREVNLAMKESSVVGIGYLLQAQGGCHSTAIDALADLHRRLRPRLRRVGFVCDTPQARGAAVLIGSRVEGLPWRTFASVDTMEAWLREGAG